MNITGFKHSNISFNAVRGTAYTVDKNQIERKMPIDTTGDVVINSTNITVSGEYFKSILPEGQTVKKVILDKVDGNSELRVNSVPTLIHQVGSESAGKQKLRFYNTKCVIKDIKGKPHINNVKSSKIEIDSEHPVSFTTNDPIVNPTENSEVFRYRTATTKTLKDNEIKKSENTTITADKAIIGSPELFPHMKEFGSIEDSNP